MPVARDGAGGAGRVAQRTFGLKRTSMPAFALEPGATLVAACMCARRAVGTLGCVSTRRAGRSRSSGIASTSSKLYAGEYSGPSLPRSTSPLLLAPLAAPLAAPVSRAVVAAAASVSGSGIGATSISSGLVNGLRQHGQRCCIEPARSAVESSTCCADIHVSRQPLQKVCAHCVRTTGPCLPMSS
eukprot:6211215-Pleurochrysis_carterae.AAC.2